MRFLVVEDDFGSRRLLQALLRDHGACDVVVDGEEAIEAFRLVWEENDPYRVIFLDIMMPRVDGHQALKSIRRIEKDFGIPDKDQVAVVLVKPIHREAVNRELVRLGLIAR